MDPNIRKALRNGTILAAAGIVALVVFTSRNKTVPVSVPASAEAPPEQCKEIGQICTIQRAFRGTDFVPAATSLSAYGEFRKSFRAGDREGMAQMSLSSEIIGTKAGDLVRVLDVSVWNDRAEVRITSGEHSGRKVWIALSWLAR